MRKRSRIQRCYRQPVLPEPDRIIWKGFVGLFLNQARFAARVIPDFMTIQQGSLRDVESRRVELTMHLLAAISNELEEVRDFTPWKHWKHYEPMTEHDRMELGYELVDVLHFLIELALVWGFDARQFTQLYQDKLAINNRRQDRGYR